MITALLIIAGLFALGYLLGYLAAPRQNYQDMWLEEQKRIREQRRR